jgi:hypothetical protein
VQGEISNFDPNFQYEKIREEIRAEHSLIANRLTWYVTSQSFLVTAFAISRGSGFTWFQWFSTVLLPILGSVSSALVFPSILGACNTIKLWHEKQHHFFELHPEFKAAFELKRPSWIENRGLLFPKIMPLMFGLFWLIVGISSRCLR